MTKEKTEETKEKDEQKLSVEEKTKEKDDKSEDKKNPLKLEKELDFEIIDGIKYPKKLIEEARFEGWRSKEFLKDGKNNTYLSPDKFLERGRKVVPFLNQKLEEKDKAIQITREENKVLKKLLEKQIKNQVIDKIETIDEKLQEAEEMGETKKVISMTRKRVELEKELSEIKKEEKKIEKPTKSPTLEKPQAVIEWELRNEWSDDPTHPKTIKANEIFNKIKIRYPYLDIKKALDLVDKNLQDYENRNKQRKNLSAPVSINKNITATGKVIRKISNLKPELKQQFEKYCVDNNGNKFKGKTLKIYEEAFLKGCDDSHFTK